MIKPQHSPDILSKAGHQWRLMGVRLGPEPFPKLYSLPKIKGLENASFRIRTQVFYRSSVVFLLKEILNSVQEYSIHYEIIAYNILIKHLHELF